MCCYGASVYVFMWTDNYPGVPSVYKNGRVLQWAYKQILVKCKDSPEFIWEKTNAWDKSVQAFIQVIAGMTDEFYTYDKIQFCPFITLQAQVSSELRTPVSSHTSQQSILGWVDLTLCFSEQVPGKLQKHNIIQNT